MDIIPKFKQGDWVIINENDIFHPGRVGYISEIPEEEKMHYAEDVYKVVINQNKSRLHYKKSDIVPINFFINPEFGSMLHIRTLKGQFVVVGKDLSMCRNSFPEPTLYQFTLFGIYKDRFLLLSPIGKKNGIDIFAFKLQDSLLKAFNHPQNKPEHAKVSRITATVTRGEKRRASEVRGRRCKTATSIGHLSNREISS